MLGKKKNVPDALFKELTTLREKWCFQFSLSAATKCSLLEGENRLHHLFVIQSKKITVAQELATFKSATVSDPAMPLSAIYHIDERVKKYSKIILV